MVHHLKWMIVDEAELFFDSLAREWLDGTLLAARALGAVPLFGENREQGTTTTTLAKTVKSTLTAY